MRGRKIKEVFARRKCVELRKSEPVLKTLIGTMALSQCDCESGKFCTKLLVKSVRISSDAWIPPPITEIQLKSSC
jgi:hypothetical protein